MEAMDSDYYSLSQIGGTVLPTSGLAGTVIKINIKNFMCFDNYEVTFNERINFICGKNGSGKSAIQTAIAVGLGGKALSTNRGSSVKALIKNDKNTCHLTIVLSNVGPMAYKPHQYGEQIEVERTFSRSSTQGYKIKNAYGKVISTEKTELDKIITQFNIQTENPMCILHQDVARNFLNVSDPKILYKFYLKATRFGEIENLHNDSKLKIIAAEGTINKKTEIVNETFKDVVEMRKKLKAFDEATQKEKQMRLLENELVWARIAENNKELQELHNKKELEYLDKQKMEKKLNDIEGNQKKEKLRELEDKLAEVENSVKDAEERMRPVKSEFVVKKELLAKKNNELKAADQTLRITNQKIEAFKKELEKAAKDAPVKKDRLEKLNKTLVDCANNIESLKSAEKNVERDKQQLSDTIENHMEELRTMNNRKADIQRDKNKREDQLRHLTENNSSLSVYGDVMAAIIKEINKTTAQGRFKQRPIGPIGMHIKVHDSTWAAAVESYLGKGTLTSFCVDNSKDLTVLSKLIKDQCNRFNHKQIPAIFCSKFLPQVHNIAQTETKARMYQNLARALEIDNSVVTNCLIDQMEIETVLLIPTNNEAYQILDEQHKVPKNCKRAFTKTGDQFYPAPNYRSYSSAKSVTHATLLQAKHEDLIKGLKSEINHLTSQVSDIEHAIQIKRKEIEKAKESLNNTKFEQINLRKQISSLGQKVIEINAAIGSENQADQGLLDEELKGLQDELKNGTEKFQCLQKECEGLKVEAKKVQNVYEKLKNTIIESDQEKAGINAEIHQLRSAIQRTSTKVDLIRHKIEEHDNKLKELDSEIIELSETLTQNEESASQICARVNTERSSSQISRELKTIVAYLQKFEEENGGPLHMIQEHFNAREVEFTTINNDLDQLFKIVRKARKSLKIRRTQTFKHQHSLSNTSRHQFQMNLNKRNLDGKLEFDFVDGTLELKVRPSKEKRPNSNSGQSADQLMVSTSSLSGGEKSFSTVCFILSLWFEMDLPFHFLDEFDVFMDGMNRRIVMDMLINHAKSDNKQFVFLTPLDMSSVSASDIVTLHRLEAPRE